MLSNGNGSKCGFEDVMVSYIYDEIATTDRRKFESHLVDCSACTDEFAAISNARFSVFEWQREEFANLSTPEIVIPYVPVVDEQASVGFLAGLRGLFSGYGVPVTVAAALLVCLCLGFAAISFLGRSEQSIASNIKVESPAMPAGTGETSPRSDAVSQVPDIGEAGPANRASASSPEVMPVKIVENRRSIRPSTRGPVNGPRYQNAQQVRKAPVLSGYDDDDDDKSLRLSDLFDGEIGGRR